MAVTIVAIEGAAGEGRRLDLVEAFAAPTVIHTATAVGVVDTAWWARRSESRPFAAQKVDHLRA